MVDNKILWNKMQLNICYPLKHQPLRTLINAWSRWDCQDLRKCLPTASLTGWSKVQQTSPSLCACGAQTTTGFLLIICLMCVQKFNILFLKNSSFALSLICSSSCTLHLTDHFYQSTYMLYNLPLKKKKSDSLGCHAPLYLLSCFSALLYSKTAWKRCQ